MPNGDKGVDLVVASNAAKEPSELETRKSAVRVLVTYIAAGFLFVVGAGFVAALLALDKVEDAKNVFWPFFRFRQLLSRSGLPVVTHPLRSTSSML